MKTYTLIATVVAVVGIASCAKHTAPAKEPVIDAAALFGSNCARCHGSTGVEGRAPKLNDINDHERVVQIVTYGHDHMPAFAGKLSVAEINAVADFVVKLGGKK